MGLAIAYNLAARGGNDVVVLERGYLAGGASGRNGGGVRQQWSTEMNIRLMQESVELCRLRGGDRRQRLVPPGRLPVPRAQRRRRSRASRRTSRCRIAAASRRAMLDPDEARGDRARARPRRRGIVGACYNPTDGILFPWPFLWGYARGRRSAAWRSTRDRRSPRSSGAQAAASCCDTRSGRARRARA